MNREILFRGFAPDENGTEKVFINGEWIKGKWVYGDLLHDRVGIFILREDKDGYEEHKVIPETIGQYTGLNDKNGKKMIFEGDILPVWENGNKYYYKVIYDGDCFMLAMLDSEQGSYPLSVKNNISEIIGNIHDNSELLKGEAE